MTAEILRNPGHDDSLTRRALAQPDDPTEFHRSIPGYAPTPLLRAPSLAAELGLAELMIKVESERFGLPAFKILGASWATFRLLSAILEQRGHPVPARAALDELCERIEPLRPLTLVAATDGNHGRAVARMAALLDAASHILVPAGTAQARIDAIAGEGADVTVVDGTYDDAVAQAASLATDHAHVVSDTSWEGYTEVPGWVIDGYHTIFAEIRAQLPEDGADIAAVQMGVGALAAAAVDALAPVTRLVIVEPTTAACGLRSAEAGRPSEVPGPHPSIMAGLNCGNVSPVAWPRVSAGAETFVAIADERAVAAMRDLASVGVVAGETGAAGLAGLRAATETRGPERVDPAGLTGLVLCTEGATDPDAYARRVGTSNHRG